MTRSWISSCLHPVEEMIRLRDPRLVMSTSHRRDDQMTRSLERPFQMNVEYHLLLIPSKLHLKGFEYFERVTEKPKL